MRKRILTMCHYCWIETYHDSLFEKKAQVIVDENIGKEYITYKVLECGGCRMISFFTRKKDPKALPGQSLYTEKNFYHHMDEDQDKLNFLRDKDYKKLPVKIQRLYDEVTSAFEEGMQAMAGIGLRTLVEAVCNHQKIPGSNLQEKIKMLHVKGMVSAAELPILDKLRLIGNKSTHGAKIFSLEKLSYALDIINHILISIYVLPKINLRLNVI